MFHFISRKLVTLLVVLLFANTSVLHAQLPGTGIYFQAVARDNASNAAKDRKIYVQSNIIQYTATGKSVLMEEFDALTDATGVFSISLGLGKKVGGTASNLQNINWSEGPYFLNLKISITPVAPVANWDYAKDLIDLGTTPFGTVPYALYAGSAYGLGEKLNTADTSAMLNAYVKNQVIKNLEDAVTSKISSADTSAMLAPYKKIVNELVASNIASLTAASINEALISKVNLVDSGLIYVTPAQLAAKTFDLAPINNNIAKKLNITDTSLMLSTRFARDTIALSNRINLKENSNNKSLDINNINDVNDEKYPTVKAAKRYIDDAVASVIVTDGSITTQKLANGAVTDSKIAPGINASKVGLGNVTNNAQLYSLNGLTNQIQTFGIGSSGTAPLFSSSTSTHTLHIPMASSTSVTAGLLSNTDWNTFNNKLSSFTETDPIVSVINGIVKSDGSFISAATAGTDYLSPTGSATNLTNFPTLNQNTTGSAASLTNAYINWNANTGGASILNKPTLFSGAYADLSGLPTLTSGTVTSVAALTIGTTGTDITSSVANGTTTPTITLNIPTASITNRGLLSATDWSTFNSKGDMTLAGVQTVTGSKTFSNTIVGSINGNAATATKLATPVTINGTSFDGSANISISTNTANALTYNNGGAGDASGNTFNGSAAKTISYNSIGAAPTIGSSSITTLGTITTGTWNGTTIAVTNGGTGATTLSSNGVLIGNGTSAITTVAPSTSGNVLTSNGTNWVSSSAAATVREVANETTATAAQTSFTLSQTPSANSKVKMFINGVRISNTAYSVSGTTLTYNPVNNGAYAITAGDRIQFDYYY
jgi:hypothetical protein